MTMYFCKDRNDQCYIGKSLLESWKSYENDCGDYPLEDLKFYKAEEVSIDVIERPVVIKVPTVKAPAAKKPAPRKK